MAIPITFNRMGIKSYTPPPPTPMPTSGLTMWHSLKSSLTHPEIGDDFTVIGNGCSLTTNEGIPCMYIDGTASFLNNTTGTYYENSNTIATLSVWAKSTIAVQSNHYCGPFSIGNWDAQRGGQASIIFTNNHVGINLYGYPINQLSTDDQKWHHYALTCDSNTNAPKLYRDGVYIGGPYSWGWTAMNVVKAVSIGGCYISDPTEGPMDDPWNGYIAGARIYNRVLTDEEIALLATEYLIQGTITPNDLTFSLYQKNETYSITYTSTYPITSFAIVSGTLPNTISFNTSTGEFSGKGLTDADHTYNLTVRLTDAHENTATCNVTIYTYMTARISLSDQTFNFISNKDEYKYISAESDESLSYSIVDGTLPSEFNFDSNGSFHFNESTSAIYDSVIVKATSEHNQTGVNATMTLDVAMNQIICNDQTFNFYTEDGSQTKAVAYSGSLNEVTDAVFTLSGTLPSGVTFDSTNGTFTSDATQTSDETAIVNVTVSSSNGTSTAATCAMTLNIHTGIQPMPTSGLTYWMPFNASYTNPAIGGALTISGATPTLETVDGIECVTLNGSTLMYELDTADYWTVREYWPEMTISYWFRAAERPSKDWVSFNLGRWNGYSYSGMSISFNTNGLFALNSFGSNTMYGSYEVGKWINIVITTDTEGNRTIYTNGEYATSNVGYSLPIATSHTISFGAEFSADDISYLSPFVGSIAGVRIYDRKLSAEEIQLLATEYTPKGMPTSGLIFYAPLQTNLNDEVHGNSLSSTVGTVTTNQNVDGIQCTTFDPYSYAYTDDVSYLPSGNNDVTISMWYKQSDDNTDFSSPQMFVHLGSESDGGHSLEMGEYLNQWHWNILNNPYEGYFGQPDNNWHHLLLERDAANETVKMYFDGVLSSSMSVPTSAFDLMYGKLLLCSRTHSGSCITLGCSIAALRIYDRALSDSEVSALAAEFTPIYS